MIKWNDEKIKKKTLDATRLAMDRVMAKCVQESKIMVPVRTATLQGSIRMNPTKVESGDLVGRWGSYNVKYAVFIELGTIHMDAQPYLRPSADKNYPSLPGEIRRAMA